jgi:ATP/maltotriose-dependent transcriptional regulator MalT
VNRSKLVEFSISGESFAVVQLGEASEAPDAELARFTVNGGTYSVVSAVPQHSPEPCSARVLTERELQIAMLVADGLVNKEIADRLRISEWTVCTHMRRIYSKLGVSTRGAMVSRTAGLRKPK